MVAERHAIPPVDGGNSGRYLLVMSAAFLKLTLLKRILNKIRELVDRPTDVHYTSTPFWRPWRDF